MNKCKCEWCHGKPNKSGNGYCRKHYDQIRNYGYILDVRGKCDDNRVIVHEDYAELFVTNSKDIIQGIAKISIEDIEKIKGHHWSDNGNGYIRTFNGTTPLYLHRYIMNCPVDLEVDHINHDKYDNRRINLRIVTKAVNKQNNTGKCIRHITDRNLKKPYMVKIERKDMPLYCKYFATEEEALSAVAKIKLKNLQNCGG